MLVLFGCAKKNSDYLEKTGGSFYQHPANTPSAVIKVINKIAEFDKKYSFTGRFTKANGYPQWDKTVILFDKNQQKNADTVVLVPLVKDGYERVTAFLACDVKSDNVLINLYRGDRYGFYPASNRTDILTRTFIANQIMFLDFLTFGHTKFTIFDSTIFNYPEVPVSKNNTRSLLIKDHQPIANGNTREMDVYISGEYCWDVWMPSSGDLVGVAPDGSIEYGHYETQCESFDVWVQMSGGGGSGSGGEAPIPPPNNGGGGGAYANTYFWDSDPCDPFTWQSPFSSCDDYGVVGWAPITTTTSEEFSPNIPDPDPDAQWWDDNTTTYPPQSLPSFALVDANYPKDQNGNDMPALQVYALIGGPLLAMRNANPQSFLNACAARVSRALNYSGVTIPQITGQTYLGGDGKYYFIVASQLFHWMLITFGTSNAVVLNRPQGGTDGSLFQGQLSGQQGIFIMQPVNSKAFGATGHATLYDGSGCVGGQGHCYFYATGGVQKIVLFKLP